jgi:hypothetical protein
MFGKGVRYLENVLECSLKMTLTLFELHLLFEVLILNGLVTLCVFISIHIFIFVKSLLISSLTIEQSCSRLLSTPGDCFQNSLSRWASPPKAINHAILMEKNINV